MRLTRMPSTWGKALALATICLIPLWVIKAQRSWRPRVLRDHTLALKWDVPVDSDKVSSLAWSPDGSHLALGVESSFNAMGTNYSFYRTEVWRVETPKMLGLLKSSGNDFVWAPDGKAVGAYTDQNVGLWKVGDRGTQTLSTISPFWMRELSSSAVASCFSRDGQALCVLCGPQLYSPTSRKGPSVWVLRRYERETGHEIGAQTLDKTELGSRSANKLLMIHGTALMNGAIANGGNTLAFIAAIGASNQAALVVRSLAPSQVLTIPLPSSLPLEPQLAMNADGSRVAMQMGDGSVSIFDTSTGKLLCHVKWRRLQTFALAPDGITIALLDGSSAVSLWDATTGTHTRTITLPDKEAAIQLQFSPDSSTLAVALQDGTVTLWRVR